MTTLPQLATAVVISLCCALPAGAQDHSRDTLRLPELHALAAQHDPRARQLKLLAAQSALRLANIAAEQRAAVTVSAQGQYQSDVLTLPLQLPGGRTIPSPAHDTYDAHLEAQQRIVDPALSARRAVERAQLAESQARVASAVYIQRRKVDDAFFDALRLQFQSDEIGASITDLEAQHHAAADRVRFGSALPSESAALRAELLRRRQLQDDTDARRRAALALLAGITGTDVPAGSVLAIPELGAAVARALGTIGPMRTRPEYEQFARSRELLLRQEDVIAARDRPRVSAYGRAGYGRPGLDPVSRSFGTYWLTGVLVQWAPWSWGTANRDRELLAIQRDIVLSDESAFTEEISRTVATSLSAIERLTATRASDDEIIALREQIAGEMRERYRESTVTAAEYVDRETDVLAARLARATHRVELEQARAGLLTLLGLEAR